MYQYQKILQSYTSNPQLVDVQLAMKQLSKNSYINYQRILKNLTNITNLLKQLYQIATTIVLNSVKVN